MTGNQPPQKDAEYLLNQLQDIATSVMYAAEADTLENVLERIAQASRELVHARYAALGVPDGRGSLKYFKVAGLTPEQTRHIWHLPVGRGLLGAIMNERQAVRLERMADDPRSAGFCAGHPPMTSLLGVPILIGQQLFGLLYLCDRIDGQPFSEQDEWLIETLAGYAALAIAGAELREKQHQLTLLEERERIGMELHDGVIQSLYAIGMHLDLMRQSKQYEPDTIRSSIDNLNSVIEDIRRYILNLKSGGYARKTVYESFRDLVGRLHIPTHLTLEIDAPDKPPPFASATWEAILQMAQEAISNAIRHAHASHIGIAVRQTEQMYHVTIRDDGRGFDLAAIRDHTGLGLANLQQRALLHGGSVEIVTTPSEGTEVTINIPTSAL